MNDNRPRITFGELPPRPRSLTDLEISSLFGGCDKPSSAGPVTCDPSCPNCCEPYTCIYKGQAPYGSYFCASG